jgi:hypothetical protein
VPIFETVDIHAATPPEALPLINNRIGTIGTAAAAMVGAIAGGIGGAALMASRRLPSDKDEAVEKTEEPKNESGAGKTGDE